MSAPSPVLTKKVPIIEAMIPMDATRRGNNCNSKVLAPRNDAPTAAKATVAIIDPT